MTGIRGIISLATSLFVAYDLPRIPVTLVLATGGLLVALMIGIPAGITAATQRDTWIDRAITGMVSVALAMPGFWIALILVFFFAIRLQWLPAAGYFPLSDGLESWLKGFILPWLALGLGALASLTRHTRSAMIEQFSSSYVRALIARGCPKRKIIFCYCLKNAMVPVLAILGMMMTIMLSGSFVIEIVFALPGLGSLIVESIDLGDAPMLQAIVVTVAIFIILVNYFIDLGYGLLNPKMRPE